MLKRRRLFEPQSESIESQYFHEIRPRLYERHGGHAQYGIRSGRSFAEHLDSACQFVLTVSKIAQVPDNKRAIILAATAVHDLNKLDQEGRNIRLLARDQDFLQEELQRACVAGWVQTDDDLELVRQLIERHSGHNASDGMRFLPEDPEIKRWAAMLIGGDLFDLGIEEHIRNRKVETELTVAMQRASRLFKVRLTEDRGYLTSLLLSACEDVMHQHGLHTLAIEPDGQIFIGEAFPEVDVAVEIATRWQKSINDAFGGNVEQLVRATKDGIKVDPQAIQQNPEAALDRVDALLVKKFSGYKHDKVASDIQKYSDMAGKEAVTAAADVGLHPISSAEEFAISEGLKAAYLSYRVARLEPREAWDRIAEKIGLSSEQRTALEPFNSQYGRCLFAAKSAPHGQDDVAIALQDSFALRSTERVEVSEEMIGAVRRLINFPHSPTAQSFTGIATYIEANPRQRCSLGSTSTQIEELKSNKMPPGTKVQAFSNRLPGGASIEPKRRGDGLAILGYQLMTVGSNFPKVGKQEPWYIHLALPRGSNPELRQIWRQFLQQTATTNEGGTVSVDEWRLYRDNQMVFKANKVVGLALPKRAEFVHSTITIPIVWGDTNSSIALLKSLRLALELSLALDMGFPFELSTQLEIEPTWDVFGRVDGIPSSLKPLLGSGQYQRQGYVAQQAPSVLSAEAVLERLQCLATLAVSVAGPQKKDDCLYDLARACTRPLGLYHVLLRWVLREQDNPNLMATWSRIQEPLATLLESLMSQEHATVSHYLRQAARLADEAHLRGSSFRRTSQAEPFAEFIKAVRARRPSMDWDTVFAALVQQYHNRLDRIREHGVGATKHTQITAFYDVLKTLFKEIYHLRSERLLNDSKTLEAAYLFFLQEARLKRNNQEQQETDND